ncbi:GumC family protein [Agaribacterium haliotis]|uniref:GumC family protein n=1 Tax=Agaribacterium haliotis TaxID=2013869 RepID=UPI000BB540DA|nr:polysaccharide biosynthesis tyrosine autokinase [Agaribacterium haliotis]
MQESSKKQPEVVDLIAYWNIVLKYKFQILGFACFSTLLAAIFIVGMDPVYRATSSILLKADQEKAVSIEDVYTLDTTRKEYFLTQYEILKSNSVAEVVVDRVDLGSWQEYQPKQKQGLLARGKEFIRSFLPKPEAQEQDEELQARIEKVRLIHAFRKNLSISPVRKTQLVRVSFEAKNPRLAALVANAVGEVYIEHQLEARLSVNKKAVGWLGERLDQLRSSLDSSEEQLQAFREKEGLIDIEGVSSIVADELEGLSQNYLEARKRRIQAESVYLLVRANDGPLDTAELSSLAEISNHPLIREIRRAEISAEKRVSELSQRYGPKHPKLIAAKAELAAVNLNLENQVAKLVKGIQKELAAARERENRLLAQLNAAKDEYQVVSSKESAYLKLKREVDTNRELYNTFLSRFKETDITTNFESQHANILDLAELPTIPVKPKKKKLIVVVFVITACLAIGIAILLESLNDSFRSAAQVEELLGLRFLGLLPILPVKKKQVLDTHLYFDEKYKDFAESVRTMRTGFVLSHLGLEHKVVSITSSLPGEGKSTTATNIAFAMAQMEKTVLIEADMRKPSFNKLFSLPPYQIGLSNIISGTEALEECIYKDERSGLDVISAGHIPPNPLELLSSVEFKQLLERLKKDYERIIIDTAPTQAVSDALVVAKLSDSLIYVVKANSTKQALVKQGIGRLLEVGAKIDGVVLNQVDTRIKGRSNGYHGYYDSYHYGQEANSKKS